MNKNLYLTDKQYTKLLLKIKEIVERDNFNYSCYDSTAVGDKFTTSNCGLCNNDLTEKDMALFPDQFPERRSKKYRLENHKCPFDMRTGFHRSGCFYQCCLFHGIENMPHTKLKKPTINQLKKLVDKTIREAKNKGENNANI